MGDIRSVCARRLRVLFCLNLGASFFAAIFLRFYSGLVTVRDLPQWPGYLAYLGVTVAVWLAVESRMQLSESLLGDRPLSRWLLDVLQAGILTLAIVSAAAFFWRDYSFSRYTITAFWGLFVSLSALTAWALRRLGANFQAAPRAEVWIATAEITEHEIRRTAPAASVLDFRRFEDAAAMHAALKEHRGRAGAGEAVYVTLGADQFRHYREFYEELERQGGKGSIILPMEGPVEQRGSLLFVPATRTCAESANHQMSKRLADLAILAAAAPLLAILMLATASLVRITSGGPVLFSQERVGRNGRRFRLYKFRTLPLDASEVGDRQWSVEPTSRAARFLRATGLDELPQVFNVLRGEMSLVGPRPERPHFVERFQGDLPFYAARHRLEAGITGWAQVNGWRGDTSIARRVEYDLYYLNHWSLAFDLRILGITLARFAGSAWNFGRAGCGGNHAGTV